MNTDLVQLVGMVVACGAAATAIVTTDFRVRHVAMIVALVVAPVLVAGDVWDESRFVDLRDEPAKLGAAFIAAGGAIAIGAAIFRRWPWAFPLLAFATLALRLPVQLGGETSNLLIPLYGVIAAQVVASSYAAVVACRSSSGDAVAPPGGHRGAEPALAVWLCRLLAVTLVLYAIQSAYSDDVSNAIENACFFLVPFAVLFVLLCDVRWDRALLQRVLWVVGAVGLAFAAVAFGEYAARELILNDELQESNQIHLYFRVNSLFHDPNVLGRYLALTMVALGVALVWTRSRAWAWLAAVVSGVLLVAMAFSFSLTSFAALVAGLLVVALLRYGWRWAATAAALMLVASAVFVGLGGTERSAEGPQRNANAELSGRTSLVSGGIDLAQDRPIWGWGSGAFGRAFTDQIEVAKTTTSHSEPITVAAEQGAIGMVAYVALLVVSLALLFTAGVRGSPARTAVAGCYVAMTVHSLGYAGFDIDPATWALLALGVVFARADPTPAPSAARS
jgi:O-antigen ligase